MRHPDENVTEFTDEVYEHENRAYPGGDWEQSEPRYVDTVSYTSSSSSLSMAVLSHLQLLIIIKQIIRIPQEGMNIIGEQDSLSSWFFPPMGT